MRVKQMMFVRMGWMPSVYPRSVYSLSHVRGCWGMVRVELRKWRRRWIVRLNGSRRGGKTWPLLKVCRLIMLRYWECCRRRTRVWRIRSMMIIFVLLRLMGKAIRGTNKRWRGRGHWPIQKRQYTVGASVGRRYLFGWKVKGHWGRGNRTSYWPMLRLRMGGSSKVRVGTQRGQWCVKARRIMARECSWATAVSQDRAKTDSCRLVGSLLADQKMVKAWGQGSIFHFGSVIVTELGDKLSFHCKWQNHFIWRLTYYAMEVSLMTLSKGSMIQSISGACR